MAFVTGKLFQQKSSRKIHILRYDSAIESYYELIRRAQKHGLQQSIITSDVMLHICEYCLFHESYELTSIDLLVEDYALDSEIERYILSVHKNPSFWTALKQKLRFLSEENSIDIKQISFKSDAGLIDIKVNGVFTVSSALYDQFSRLLISIMEDFIK